MDFSQNSIVVMALSISKNYVLLYVWIFVYYIIMCGYCISLLLLIYRSCFICFALSISQTWKAKKAVTRTPVYNCMSNYNKSIHIHTYIYIYIHTYVHTGITYTCNIYLSLSISLSVSLSLSMYIYIYIHTYIYICIYARTPRKPARVSPKSSRNIVMKGVLGYTVLLHVCIYIYI